VNHVGLLEMNVDVAVGMRRLEILQHHDFTVGLQFFAGVECLLRQSIRGRCRNVQTHKPLSCGSAMRVLVFSWASTVAPAACRLALLSAWSKCQCVSITVFSGALPSPSSVSFNFGQAGRRNVSTTILPSGPVQQHNVSSWPGKQREIFRQRLRLDRGSTHLRPHGRETVCWSGCCLLLEARNSGAQKTWRKKLRQQRASGKRGGILQHFAPCALLLRKSRTHLCPPFQCE
jgi:hypothetical protein